MIILNINNPPDWYNMNKKGKYANKFKSKIVLLFDNLYYAAYKNRF